MDKEIETASERNRSGIIWNFVICAAVGLVVYVLLLGPLMVLASRRKLSPVFGRPVEALYAPLAWAYAHTPLHKPLGMYLHLWEPKRFDSSGNMK